MIKNLLLCLIIAYAEAAPKEGKDVNCHQIPKTPLNTTCCAAPEIIKKSVIKECEDETEGQNYSEVMRECMMTECVVRKSDYMKDGQFSQEKILAHIGAELADQPQWNELLTAALKTCLKKGHDQKEQIANMFTKPPFAINPKECHPVSMYVANCVDAEMLVNCPEKSWSDNKSCNAWRSYLSKCDIFENIPVMDVNNAHLQ